MLILACEVLKPELEHLASSMPNPPEMIFLSQRLHDYPEKLREGVQEAIDAIENERPEIKDIALGYGLCGKGLTGVTTKRARLIIPRLHDCIPFLLGLPPDSEEASSRDGKTYWISPGWLDSFLAEYHLTDSRFKKYSEKFGPKRAEKMVQAENALLSGYETACHIRWETIGDAWVEQARNVAQAVGLEYLERIGSPDYLRAFLDGANDHDLFIRLEPGQTIDMDTEGHIIVIQTESI